MGIKQVGVGATLLLLVAHQCELVAYQFPGVVAVEKARPQAHFPSHAPSCGRVATVDERLACGGGQFGCVEGRYLVAGIECIQVRHMAVDVVRIVPIVHPFLQLSPASCLQGHKSGEFVAEAVEQRVACFLAKDFGGIDDMVEEVIYQFVVHGDTGSRCGIERMLVFRRQTWAYHPMIGAGFAHHDLVEETCRILHDGVEMRQMLLVAGI